MIIPNDIRVYLKIYFIICVYPKYSRIPITVQYLMYINLRRYRFIIYENSEESKELNRIQ